MTFKTGDYEMFKRIDSNRPINAAHVETLMRSIKTRNMLEFRPILVNSKFGVVDGQHRLEAAKRLGIEIYYTVSEDAKVSDVMTLNLAQRNWGASDFINYHAQTGNESYKKLQAFSERYGIKSTNAARLLLGTCKTGGGLSKMIKEGNFVYPDNEEGEKIAIQVIQNTNTAIALMKQKCLGDKHFLSAWRLREAIEDFLSRPDVDFDTFLQKIALRADALSKRTGYGPYMDMLKAIYNYYNKEPIP